MHAPPTDLNRMVTLRFLSAIRATTIIFVEFSAVLGWVGRTELHMGNAESSRLWILSWFTNGFMSTVDVHLWVNFL